MKTHVILFIVFCWLTACDNNDQIAGSILYQGSAPTISTSAEYYRAGYTTVTVENNTSQGLFVETCGGVLYHTREKLMPDNSWVVASVFQCGSNPLTNESIQAHSSSTFNIYLSKPGTYRFRIPFSINGSSSDALSNEFVVY